MAEIPKNTCRGCAARDGIIRSLARRVEELEKRETEQQKKEKKKAA